MSWSSLIKVATKLTNEQIEKYLLSMGWSMDGEVGKVASIWHNNDNQDAELLLPRHGFALDYEDRLVDLLIELARFETKTYSQIIESIENLSADLVKVRVIHSDVGDGTIPLDDGVMLHERARDLMAAAALSTSTKKKHFVGARSPEASDYVSHLKLGQTEIGSYVINIISPIDMPETNQSTVDMTSFSRMVTHTLASGLSALHTAANKYTNTKEIGEFLPTIEKGASANMCEALLGFSGRNRQRSFTISITPSLTQKMPRPDISLEFSFQAESLPALEKAAEFFKDNYVIKNKSILGHVKRLDRTPGASSGTVSVNCLVNDIEKNVLIELDELQYTDAIHAHEQKQLVTCNGDIHVSPRSARLINPAGFRVLKSGEIF